MADPSLTRVAELAARRCPGLAGLRRCGSSTDDIPSNYGAIKTAQ